MEKRVWTDGEKAFAKHRHEWLHLGNIPSWSLEEMDAHGLSVDSWRAVINAYSAGDDFGGVVPGDGKPRFKVGWTDQQIKARRIECAKLAPILCSAT